MDVEGLMLHLVERGRDDPEIVGIFTSEGRALDVVSGMEGDPRRRYDGDYVIRALELDEANGSLGWIAWAPRNYSERPLVIIEKRGGAYAGEED